MGMDRVEAVFNSNIFWGVITLILAALGLSGRLSMKLAEFVLVLAWGLGCFGLWRSGLPRDPKLMGSMCLGLASVLLLLAYWMIPGDGFSTSTLPNEAVESPQATPPSLTARFTQENLPISIHPQSTAYILRLYPNNPQWMLASENDGRRTIKWPVESEATKIKKTSKLYDKITVCELTNPPDSKTLTDVSMDFEVRFHEPKEVKGAVQTKNPDGTMTLSFPFTVPSPGEPAGWPVYVESEGDTGPKALTAGAILTEVKQRVSIPVLMPNSTVKLYLVNQTRFVVTFDFPKDASGLRLGETELIPIKLVRTEVKPLNEMPGNLIAPTKYRWRGVPDSP
jgi:hypothetical protein